MHRSFKHLAIAAALLALAGAQVFGLQRGYVCLCSGEAIETVAPSCEKDHNCCDHEHEGLPHDHAPLKVKHEAQGKTAAMPQVQAPVLVAVLEFDPVAALPVILPPAVMAAMQAPPGRCVNPPASLLVAQCMVLLV